MRQRIDRGMDALLTALGWLVLPVSALLFLQWPLREWLHAWSREANDLAQWLFALYVAAALTRATRSRAHLGMPSASDRALRIGGALCLLPWAGFILIAGAPAIWRSVAQGEAFPETYNPGYWIVKLAAGLLALLVVGQALLDRGRRR